MAMREITRAEYELLDTLDRAVLNTLPVEWLRVPTRAMAKRMVFKGLLSKREFRRGEVRATQFGLRHWMAFKSSQ